MKLITLSISMSLLLLTFSCKKDEPVVVPEKKDLKEETVNTSMTKTQVNMYNYREAYYSVTPGSTPTGSRDEYRTNLNYRLAEGYVKNNQTFYPIERSWDVNGKYVEFEEGMTTETTDLFEKSKDWAPLGLLYRYDINNEKALIYNDVNSDGQVIMDFDLIVGQKWFFDEEGEIGIIVEDKFEFTSEGVTYPALVVNYINRYPSSPHHIAHYPAFVISPLNPNPLMMGDHYRTVEDAEWSLFQEDNELEPEQWLPTYCDGWNDLLITWETDDSFDSQSYPVDGIQVTYRD